MGSAAGGTTARAEAALAKYGVAAGAEAVPLAAAAGNDVAAVAGAACEAAVACHARAGAAATNAAATSFTRCCECVLLTHHTQCCY